MKEGNTKMSKGAGKKVQIKNSLSMKIPLPSREVRRMGNTRKGRGGEGRRGEGYRLNTIKREG